jgi:uncharacterized protein (TIGR02996 family)
MSDNTAFLRAVLEHPDDDGPRLVYADWLDEQGQADRAEFIRVQCELAADWSCCRCTRHQRCGFCRLQRREWELWGDGRMSQWFPTVRMAQTIGLSVWESAVDNRLPIALICRGFIDSLICTAEALLGGPCRGCIEPGESDDGDSRCRLCHGTGRTVGCADALLWRPGQGRPCPATAQPVRRLVLTTWPDMMTMYVLADKHGFGGSPGNGVGRWGEILTAEFSGTTLELPSAGDEPFATPHSYSTPHVRGEPP